MKTNGQLTGTVFQSPFFSWERVQTQNKGVYIQTFKMQDRWVILATNGNGQNYIQDCGSEDKCYGLIENAYPVTRLVGNRREGAIEIIDGANTITL
jgi:hypothetical protein